MLRTERRSPFCPSPLFCSKGTPKTLSLGPYQIGSFIVATTTKRGFYRKHPFGGQSVPSGNHRFPQVGEIR